MVRMIGEEGDSRGPSLGQLKNGGSGADGLVQPRRHRDGPRNRLAVRKQPLFMTLALPRLTDRQHQVASQVDEVWQSARSREIHGLIFVGSAVKETYSDDRATIAFALYMQ